jgi:secreted trypsin-like serine protease
MRPVHVILAGVAALAVAAPAFAITGGTLDGNGHPAVALLLADRGNGPEPDCSAALVAPRVLVTAAHCAEGTSSNRVEVTFDSVFAGGSSSVFAGTLSPDPAWSPGAKDTHDLAVVVLDDPAPVAPLSLPQPGTLDKQALRGAELVNVGYGYFDRTFVFDGYRRVSTSSFTSLKPSELKLSQKPGGVCFGDSGGPRLLGTTVVAVTSTGNNNCTGQSTSYRLDTPEALAFVARYNAGH